MKIIFIPENKFKKLDKEQREIELERIQKQQRVLNEHLGGNISNIYDKYKNIHKELIGDAEGSKESR